MFVVQEMSDIIRVPPSNFESNGYDTLSFLLENKFCNKIIAGVGLFICVYQVDEILESFNIPQDGGAFCKVIFRGVIFRPIIGEIIQGTVKYCVRNYVKVTLEFFDDVIIHSDQLPQPIEYIEQDCMFKWSYVEQEQSTGDSNHGFFICQAQPIRFQVLEVHYDHDIVLAVEKESNSKEKTGFMEVEAETGHDSRIKPEPVLNNNISFGNSAEVEIIKKRKPMAVLGSIVEMGLGPVEWWRTDDNAI